MLPLPLQTRILFKDIFHKNPDYIGLIPVRIAERKNIEFAIKFAKEARDKFKVKFFFIITGALHLQNPETIHYFKYLKKLIQQDDLTDNFCFLYQFGLSTGEQFDIYKLNIRDLYIISDFLFLPSKGEGFGLPIIEAGFMRIPIFVSELPVFKEVGNGFINTFNLDDDINITVSKTLNYLNRNRATIFHKHILKNFSLEAIVQNKIIDLL